MYNTQKYFKPTASRYHKVSGHVERPDVGCHVGVHQAAGEREQATEDLADLSWRGESGEADQED